MVKRFCGFVPPLDLSAFVGFRFPLKVIMLAVRWHVRFGLSYRDLEELLAKRGIEVDHGTLFRWVQRFTPLLVAAAPPSRHAVGSRLFVDETYVKVARVCCYLYLAVDEHGQVIDVHISRRRDIAHQVVLRGGGARARSPRRGRRRPPPRWRTSSTSSFLTRDTTPTSTRTTASNATTAGSKRDYDQCAASHHRPHHQRHHLRTRLSPNAVQLGLVG